MTKKMIKNRSKRLTLRKKHKIEKKVKEHHRKVRKIEAAKKRRKDPGFPTDVPFMKKLISEAKETKAIMSSHERELQKSIRMNKKRNKSDERSENTLKVVSYKDQLQQVVKEADVILLVLDARDPIGTRCSYIENTVTELGKKLVFILNKIDLVPRENVLKWLAYLRRSHPTIAFKCNTQDQAHHLSAFSKKLNAASDHMLKKSSACFGIKEIMSLLGNYCRVDSSTTAEESGAEPSKEAKVQHIKVGVVGLPNTGKSSFVNSLKRERVCGSSNLAGTTKHCEVVKIDKNIDLIDSPGVVLAASASDNVELALKNMIRPEQISDVRPVVEAIARRCGKDYFIQHYSLPNFDNMNQFMVTLAQRFSCYDKGGILNLDKAGKMLIRDWVQGKIKYSTCPPEEMSTTVLPELSAPFDLFSDETLNVPPSVELKTIYEVEDKEENEDEEASEMECTDEDESSEEMSE